MEKNGTRVITIARFYRIHKTQAELDFVDIPLNQDIPLFIDPFAMSQRQDRWGQKCHQTLTAFFQRVIDNIRNNKLPQARALLSHLREPNETRFGYSASRPQGAGIGRHQANQLFKALWDSSAVKTGFINSLEECELMIEGISRDKISDLTTNVIRKHLADYTVEQCKLFGIPTRPVSLAPHYSPERESWINQYLSLPVVGNKPILFVPKVIARYDSSYDHHKYYRDFVLEYLRAEALTASSSLVRTLKNGRRVIYKKDLERIFPCTKENLFNFSKEHPEILKKYRKELEDLEKKGIGTELDEAGERLIARALIEALKRIPPGHNAASKYHDFMIGILEFLFYPNLLYPQKEKGIHQDRKRIDIVMENGAREGIFRRLHEVRKLPCAFVAFECKNYNHDVKNPEIDQLAGRFSPNRGKLGMLCCRQFKEKTTFIDRCRDTLRDDRGLIIPLEDRTIIEMLSQIERGQRSGIEDILTKIINTIWHS